MHWSSTKWASIHLQAEQIAATDWNDHVNTNLNVKLGKHRNSVPNCQSIWQKQVWQLKSQIGKLCTIREGIKKIRDVEKYVNNPRCLVKHALKHLPCYQAWMNETRTGVVCFDCKTIYVIVSSIMWWGHEERLIAAKTQTTNGTFS